MPSMDRSGGPSRLRGNDGHSYKDTIMKPFEPNLSTLAVARDILLTPFGLDEGKLLKTLGAMGLGLDS